MEEASVLKAEEEVSAPPESPLNERTRQDQEKAEDNRKRQIRQGHIAADQELRAAHQRHITVGEEETSTETPSE